MERPFGKKFCEFQLSGYRKGAALPKASRNCKNLFMRRRSNCWRHHSYAHNYPLVCFPVTYL
jgi:hypothetical protein